MTFGRRAGRQTSNLIAFFNSVARITPKLIPITIYLSSSLHFGVTAGGDSWPAGGEADVKYSCIIEISDPNNPKIYTQNDISVIFFEFCCDGGRRVTFGLWAGRRVTLCRGVGRRA